MIHIAYGMPGSGKSTLLHDLVAALCHQHRFLVVDHEAQWGPDGVHWRGRPPPITVIYPGSRLPEEWPDAGVFTFRGWEPRDVAQLVIDLGFSVYVDDEIDKAGRREGFDKSPLRALVNEGRHVQSAEWGPSGGIHTECHVFGACRRPQKVHNDLSELADEVYVFRCEGNRTLSRLLDDGHITEEQQAFVPTLPNFELLHYPSRRHLRIQPVFGPRVTVQSEPTEDAA